MQFPLVMISYMDGSSPVATDDRAFFHALGYTDDDVCSRAHRVNQVMALHVELRDSYRAIWGTEWEPLPTVGGTEYFRTLGFMDDTNPGLPAFSASERAWFRKPL